MQLWRFVLPTPLGTGVVMQQLVGMVGMGEIREGRKYISIFPTFLTFSTFPIFTLRKKTNYLWTHPLSDRTPFTKSSHLLSTLLFISLWTLTPSHPTERVFFRLPDWRGQNTLGDLKIVIIAVATYVRTSTRGESYSLRLFSWKLAAACYITNSLSDFTNYSH